MEPTYPRRPYPWFQDSLPEVEIFREEFFEGRLRQMGPYNPTEFDVSFWKKMVRSGEDPYFVGERFGHQSIYEEPTWCFARLGMTLTPYNNQWVISIGGEHEDGGMPNFMIYNDVIVRDYVGGVWIFGYPADVFPPIDFHTATLFDPWSTLHLAPGIIPDEFNDTILIVGGLGYEGDREWWRTPVYQLDLSTMRILALETKGQEPGWIYRHDAAITANGCLRVLGGLRIAESGEREPFTEEFELDLASLSWSRVR